MVTLGSLLLVLLMAALGYKRGIASLGSALLVLVVSSLLARPLYPLTGWLVKMAGAPKLLVPTLATLCSGILLFLLLLVPVSMWVKKTMGEGEGERPSWDRPLGAVAGGVWGMALTLLILVGLSTVARVDRAMRIGNAEAAIRAEARQKFERQADQELRPLIRTMTRKRYEEEKLKLVAESEQAFFVDPAELRERTAEGGLDGFLVDMEHSPFEAVVDKVSPVTVNTEKVLRDLTIVVGDPVLFARFRLHPTVRQLMSDPTVLALSEDQEIARAVTEGRYRDLLDHPKLIAAVEDDAVRAKFAKVDMAQILEDTRNKKPIPEG